MCSDIIFYSFGVFILGLVLLFASYDILLKLLHNPKRRNFGLIFSFIFLLLMGVIFLVLASLVLARLYFINKIIFTISALFFLAVAIGTYYLMKWKREVIKSIKKNE